MTTKINIRKPARMPEFVTRKGRKLEALYSLFVDDKFMFWSGKDYVLSNAAYYAAEGKNVQIVRR